MAARRTKSQGGRDPRSARSARGRRGLTPEDEVTAILLGKRGISARYVARCLSRMRGYEIRPEDVERAALARVRRVNRAAVRR